MCREEKRKATWGHTAGTGNQWSQGSGWKLCFKSLFLLPKGGDVILLQKVVSWEREVSP
jgi:hypothetical protein